MSLSSDDLAAYIGRMAAGDRDALTPLYRATSLKLFGIVFRILRRRAVAEEILQEVYVRIWERAGDFDAGRASPITWMATIARNRALDEVRRRQPVLVQDEAGMFEAADPADSAPAHMERSEDLRRLEQCLDTLEERRRSIVRLAYLDGLSRLELSERFGQPVATIKTWLHRSLKQLQVCLET